MMEEEEKEKEKEEGLFWGREVEEEKQKHSMPLLKRRDKKKTQQ